MKTIKYEYDCLLEQAELVIPLLYDITFYS
jgi:hypothetical protein